jgi:hypothetical protein
MKYQVGQKKQVEKIGFNTNKKISNYVGTHCIKTVQKRNLRTKSNKNLMRSQNTVSFKKYWEVLNGCYLFSIVYRLHL